MTEPSGPLRPATPAGFVLGDLTGEPEHTARVRGVSHDSRSVEPGDLYVGLPGSVTHGARFAPAAVDRGALAVLTDAAGAAMIANATVPVIVVADPRSAMADWAARAYGRPGDGLLLAGITGTNGKTTTAFLLEAALRAAGRRVGTVGTIGFRLDGEPIETSRTTVTTPESSELQALLAVMAERGADAVAMEVSSHALVLHRVDALHFDVVAFTNLGRDHLDFHPTLDDYFEAKALLFAPGRADVAVVNVDDAYGVRLAERILAAGAPRLVRVGTGADADVRIASSSVRPDGRQDLRLRVRGHVLDVEVGMPGEYNVANAATALAMIDAVGLDVGAAAAGLADAEVPGRMQRVPLPPPAPTVLVDFAHTPQAVTAALSAVNAGSRVIAVLGCGGDRDADKRGPMGAAAVQGADLVIVTDDNPRTEDPAAIRAAVLAGARDAVAAATPGTRAARCTVLDGGARRDAIAHALAASTGQDDVVLVLGKGHEQGQEVNGQVLPFDDVSVVAEQWLRQKEGGRHA